ncbi:sugar phosphate isomerase/epimerase family protein [Actinomadura sp. KC216]|uniref:sugar phosphate isomerase/epimerase family protein n=1 Tax=Actinomadura sp. KC216 TaxID=2530370 RepID=UPI0014050551|nr:sugar phosphate isomerase/epimerase family protein [Actinomadura sp. KC216]
MDEASLAGTTWSCADQDLLTALDTLLRAGFTEVEIWAEGRHLDPRVEPDVEAVAGWLRRSPLTVRSVHLPFDGVLPDRPADERAAAWIRLCTRTLDHAAALGARLAVAHPVLFPDPADRAGQAADRFVRAADAIAAQAERRGIRLTLENMHTMRGPTLRTVQELTEALDRMTIGAGICVDTGHAVFNGRVGADLAAEIVQAGARLATTHVHDSDAIGRDPHLVPGDGIVDWAATLGAYETINYQGRYVLEVRGGDDPLATLGLSRQRLLDAANGASQSIGKGT